LISVGCQIVPGNSRSEFVLYDGIDVFAQNGMTSAKMLQRTCLGFIEEEPTAKRAEAWIHPGERLFMKRIDL
jgi:hypothetical protein